jgi:DNA (cytosine-5)-methyltransferase 1
MNCVDIFSGCGGLTLGLHKAGVEGLFAIEKSPDAFATLKANLIDKQKHFRWPEWLPQQAHDINHVLTDYREQLTQLRGHVDLLAGGPPCQGFSLAGRRRNSDHRNKLVHSYIAMVDAIQPKFLLFENVKGFSIPFSAGESQELYSALVVTELRDRGYDVAFELVDFSRFGVPQRRTRFILIGVCKEMFDRGVRAKSFFTLLQQKRQQFLADKDLPNEPISVRAAISDLLAKNGLYRTDEFRQFDFGHYGAGKTRYQRLMRGNMAKGRRPDSHRFARHSKTISERFQIAIDEDLSATAYRQRFQLKKSSTKRLSPNAPTPTLTTLPDDYIHYCEPRILTVREYARIQSFPDDYVFKGKYTTGGKARVKEVPRYSQIGNAIPPLFGEIAGIVLQEMCNGF